MSFRRGAMHIATFALGMAVGWWWHKPAPMSYDFLYGESRAMFAYESPLPAWPPPEEAVRKFRYLGPLFEWNVAKQLALWASFVDEGLVRPEHHALLQDSLDSFPDLDRTTLFCMLRHFKPKTMVEIGAGESTYVAEAALKENGNGVEHIVVEPYRASSVPGYITVIEKEVQVLAFATYDALTENDVLFIDSSHVTMPYGDTVTELITILPRLAPGVIVHVHDIFLPFDYMPNWGTDSEKNKLYTEQWLVALMLYGAESEWEVLWGSRLMMQEHADAILKMPAYPLRSGQTKPNGGSLWLRKVGRARREEG